MLDRRTGDRRIPVETQRTAVWSAARRDSMGQAAREEGVYETYVFHSVAHTHPNGWRLATSHGDAPEMHPILQVQYPMKSNTTAVRMYLDGCSRGIVPLVTR